MRLGRIALVGCGLVVSTIAPRLLAFPVVYLGPDEVAYGLIAREISDGHWPYATAFDHKPVGLYLPFVPVMAGAEDSLTGLRLLALVVTVLGFLLAYAVARRLGLAPVPSVLLATAFGWFSLGHDGLAMLSEHLLNVYLLGLVLILLARLSPVSATGFGVLVGVSLGTNYLSGPLVTVVGLAFLWRCRRRPWLWVWSATGFLTVTAALLAPVAAWSDLRDYLQLQATFLGGYGGEWVTRAARIDAWQEMLRPTVLMAAVVAALTAAIPRTRTRDALGWWVLGAVGVVASSINQALHPHYALLLAPVLVGLLAVTMRELGRREAVWVGALAAAVTAWSTLLPVLPVVEPGARSIIAQRDLVSDRADPRIRVAAEVRRLIRPGEEVYTRDVHTYLLTGAALPTRFFFPDHHLQERFTAVRGTTPAAEVASIVDRAPALVILDDTEPDPLVDAALVRYLDVSCRMTRQIVRTQIWVCR